MAVQLTVLHECELANWRRQTIRPFGTRHKGSS